MPPTGPPTGPRSPRSDAAIARDKPGLRTRIQAERAGLPAGGTASTLRTVRALNACRGHQTVACYVSVGDEPPTCLLIKRLHARGVRILLPLLAGRREPDWAWYTGRDHLVPGWRGIPEPDGPALGRDALGAATFVWTSALAVTARGDRLGTGGGWYDRALAYASPTATIGVLVNDREILPELPVEEWDRRVHVIVSERRTIPTLAQLRGPDGRDRDDRATE